METINTTQSTDNHLKDTLFDLKQRTHQLFLGQLDDQLGQQNPSAEHSEIVKGKFTLKYERYYKDMGKIVPPGVLVEENK